MTTVEHFNVMRGFFSVAKQKSIISWSSQTAHFHNKIIGIDQILCLAMETMKPINIIMIGSIKIFTLMLCNIKIKDWGSLMGRYFVAQCLKKRWHLRVFARLTKKKILKYPTWWWSEHSESAHSWGFVIFTRFKWVCAEGGKKNVWKKGVQHVKCGALTKKMFFFPQPTQIKSDNKVTIMCS